MRQKVSLLDVTAQTIGKITSIKDKGLNSPTVITVEYSINGKKYDISEPVALKHKFIKLGFLPIGQKKVPRLPSIAVGTQVAVIYNSNKPSQAYIDGNQYSLNC